MPIRSRIDPPLPMRRRVVVDIDTPEVFTLAQFSSFPTPLPSFSLPTELPDMELEVELTSVLPRLVESHTPVATTEYELTPPLPRLELSAQAADDDILFGSGRTADDDALFGPSVQFRSSPPLVPHLPELDEVEARPWRESDDDLL